MSNNYKVVLNGTYQQQTINNILYFGRTDGTDVEESLQAYDELAAAIDANLKTPFLSAMTGTYVLQSYSISIVNELGETVSSFPYEYAVGGSGVRGGTPDGAVMCAVLAFRCSPQFDGQTARVPKRSYIVPGPIASEDIGSNQEIASLFRGILQTLGDAIANFSAIVGAQAWTVTSTRTGVRNALGVGAQGQIEMTIVRPNAVPRRSRSVGPSGS